MSFQNRILFDVYKHTYSFAYKVFIILCSNNVTVIFHLISEWPVEVTKVPQHTLFLINQIKTLHTRKIQRFM
jgi:hypothetical protein